VLVLTASISCFISTPVSLDPSLDSPDLSSSYVIVPLSSVSMLLNICFKPLISSSERFSAITFKKVNLRSGKQRSEDESNKRQTKELFLLMTPSLHHSNSYIYSFTSHGITLKRSHLRINLRKIMWLRSSKKWSFKAYL
jgi:hypothetical protein